MSEKNENIPKNRRLANPCLIEAWLQVHWELIKGQDQPLPTDPDFPFAVGLFYNYVKDRFPYKESLDVSNAPQDLFPNVTRYRFRSEKDSWPLLQIGPGTCTINFTEKYNWNSFLDSSNFLRQSIIQSYVSSKLNFNRVFLRYKNAVPFEYSKNDFTSFIRNNLNTQIILPKNIPGKVASKESPTNSDILFSFDLINPKGTGTIRYGSGRRKVDNTEMVLFQFEIASGDIDTPDLYNEINFMNWLDKAHSDIHEWFFSMIDGELAKKLGVFDE